MENQKELKIEYRDISTLVPFKRNPKQHPEVQVANIARSIEKFGWRNPVLINAETGEIVAGHGRILAAKKLGITSIPTIDASDMTDEQIDQYRYLDNKLAESPWDIDVLAEDLQNLDFSDFDLEWDFIGDLADEEDPIEVEDDDFDESEVKETRVKRGDVWQLGRHRLMCGDSENEQQLKMLMNGEKADMIMTDPPYGISAEKMTLGTGKKNFHRGDWDSKRPNIKKMISMADNVCVWGGNYFADVLPVSNDWLVWHKKNDGLSFSEFEMAWTNFGCNSRIVQHHWSGEKKLHPTAKPVYVISWAIERCKKDCGIILDLFCGSGTTMIACEQLGRRCYGMELDEVFCEVILRRWENATGGEAVLLHRDN